MLGVQVFESFVGVLRLIETVKPPPLAPGLEHLMKQANQESQGNGATGSSYARIEADAVWNCIQKEIQKLLAELLQHSSQLGNHREYQAYGEFTYHPLLHAFLASSLHSLRHLFKHTQCLVMNLPYLGMSKVFEGLLPVCWLRMPFSGL